MRLFLRALLRRRPLAAASLAILAAIALAASVSPWLPLPSATQLDVEHRLLAPAAAHPFGTDNFGRDVLSRVIASGRVSLLIGLAVMALSTIAGTAAGLAAGYYRRVDAVLMRLLDGLLAFPALLLAIALVAALGANARDEVIAIALVFFPRTARIVRASTLQLKERTFVEAAVALGEHDGRILVVHILRNCVAPLIVQSTFVFAEAILADAALSFLGLGVRPPTPTWGNMLDDAHVYVATAPWFVFFPGGAIVLTVLCLNLVGDAVRDLADPHAIARRRGRARARQGVPEPAQE
ncbi:MAG TPA: ABC transporter permease [bacterium]|nr:ABC transporter permease [bacterium]